MSRRALASSASLLRSRLRPASIPLSRALPVTLVQGCSVRHLNTVNNDEIAHFSKLSQHWWDESGEFGLLHRMNPARVEYIRQKVALDPASEPEWTFEGRHNDRKRVEEAGSGRWLQGLRCLDVGCGGGLLAETLARLGGDVVAVDASSHNIAIARTHASNDPLLPYVNEDGERNVPASIPGRLEYRHTSAEALRAAGETFDVVCSMEVIEHVDSPGEFLKCLGDMVRPGGHLILSTISRTPLAQFLTITIAEDLLRFVTPGTHHHHKYIRPEELRRYVAAEMGGDKAWVRTDGVDDMNPQEIGETQGIIYDPIGGVWRLWPGAQGTFQKKMGEIVNYMFHVKKRAE